MLLYKRENKKNMENTFQINDVIQITKSNNKKIENTELVVDDIHEMDGENSSHLTLINTKDFTKIDLPIRSGGHLGNEEDDVEFRFIARGDTSKAVSFSSKIRENASSLSPTKPEEEDLSLPISSGPIHVNETDIRRKATVSWQIIDAYFRDNHSNLVAHHLDSVNRFYKDDIPQIFRENNPFCFIEPDTVKHRKEVLLYLGGKEGKQIYYGKPVIYDENQSHYMFPNEARLRNMTYGITIHFDVDVEIVYYERDGSSKEMVHKVHTKKLEKVFLGRFPIMLQSNLCVLTGLHPEVRFQAGECRNDFGGYFIVDGQEKVFVPQERIANNTLSICKSEKPYSYSANIYSVSENSCKPIRKLSVCIVAPNKNYTNNQIVVCVPNITKPVPLFVLMRALGVISDYDIIQTCLLDMDDRKAMLDLFIPSVHDAYKIFNQQNALEYVAEFTKRKTINGVLEILADYFLPHIGELNLLEKAYFLGYMVYRLLRVFNKQDQPTDMNHSRNKRIELSGDWMRNVFREYYLIQKREIEMAVNKEYEKHRYDYDYDGLSNTENKFLSLVDYTNYVLYFKQKTLAKGFQEAFRGNTKILHRTNWYDTISQLRKIQVTTTGERVLKSIEWGFIDPIYTSSVEKYMAISASISIGFSKEPIIQWLYSHVPVRQIVQCQPKELAHHTKVFVNGDWIGVTAKPFVCMEQLKLYRRNGLLPISLSFAFNISQNEIIVYTDSGRLMRPLFFIDDQKVSYDRRSVREPLDRGQLSWEQIVTGLLEKNDKHFSWKANHVYKHVEQLYASTMEDKMLYSHQSVVEYVDGSETDSLLIATKVEDLTANKWYTHVEIDPSLILGVTGNMVVYPEHNPALQNFSSCAQTKQAISMYHSNYQVRMDNATHVLHYGQTPLVKSRYLELINNEEQPYGINAIVAIMTYAGYNVDNAILVNEGSIMRGMFSSTSFTVYEGKEHSSHDTGNSYGFFMNTEANDVLRKKRGYDYTHLDAYGMIRPETIIEENMILIGKGKSSSSLETAFLDDSIKANKGQQGIVDKTFVTASENGSNVAKVRLRDYRLLNMGDQMASRSGQKGVVGIVLPEDSMPFMQNGMRPDIIINPHSFPSGMNIGQIIESMLGIVCTSYGAYGDCTAFQVKGPNYSLYGSLLTKAGFNHTGNHILYNGMTGEQISANIYMGPTYYMRLKNMVKDKISYRGRAPSHYLTRQPVHSDTSNVNIGEMERDALCAHGLSYFLNESFMVRGDEYYMAVCNKTGAISVYNSEINVFLSPFADGPIRFHTNPQGGMNVQVMTRYGRSFSLLRIPYAFKLLIQELQVMNIQMRLVTDANVDQLMSMTFSNNITRLLQIPNAKDTDELKNIVESYVETIRKNIHPAAKWESQKLKSLADPDTQFTSETKIKEEEQQEEQQEEQKGKEQVNALDDVHEIPLDEIENLSVSNLETIPDIHREQSTSDKQSTSVLNTTKKISILEVESKDDKTKEDKQNEHVETNDQNDDKSPENKDTSNSNGETKKIITFAVDTKQ